MFFGTGFILFFLLTGYTYARLLSLVTRGRHRLIFTVAFWLVALSFPGLEFLSHADVPRWLSRFTFFGRLSLPYLLYLFLFVLASDILRLINRIFHILPAERLKTSSVRFGGFALLLLFPAAVVLAGWTWNNLIQVNHYQVDIPGRSSPARQFTLAVASDFHLGEFTDPEMMQWFADRVNALHADLLLLPGDLLEGDRQNGRSDEFAEGFRKISTRYGLFASPGNHESHGRRSSLTFFQKSGITVLQDSAVLIDGALWLIGRKDSRVEGRKAFSELMGGISDSLPVIVLDHKPTDLKNISATRADIVVCGHTHNGQLWPLNYITDAVYDIGWGYRKIGSLNVFVTSGVQVWGPPVRTAGESEIMLIKVLVSGQQPVVSSQ